MKNLVRLIAIAAVSGSALVGQSVSSSTSVNASASSGQAGANANANQNVQSGASANTGASAQPQAGQERKGNDRDQKAGQPGSSKTNATAGGSAAASGTVNGGGASAALSSGTTLQAALTKSVDAKKAKPGDEVTAKVTQDVKANGKVVVRKGTTLVGHVTEAQARSKEHADSKLGIVFDKAVLHGDQELMFTGVVQALAPPVQLAASGMADESSMLSAPAPSAGGGRSAAGGGVLGGVASTATGTVGATTHTVAGATGAVNGTAGGAAGGLTAQGALTGNSRGVFGLDGLTLNSATGATAAAQGSVISSTSRNVRLDSGTQMLVQASGAASGTVQH